MKPKCWQIAGIAEIKSLPCFAKPNKIFKFVDHINILAMIQLQDSISLLKEFKYKFGDVYGITKLGIFGSVARGENTENSDIDIVVEVKTPTLALMHNLHQAIASLFNCKVDLVRLRKSLRPMLLSNINNEAVYV